MEQLTIKKKTYNNKSRQGEYIYIRAKGKPSRAYKYTKGKTNINALKQYYTDKYMSGKETSVLPVNKKGHLKSIKEIKAIKAPPISQLLKTGTAFTVIQNARTASQQTLNQAKRRLITKLIEKPEYVSLMIRKENLTKIKRRLIYDIEYKDAQGKTLITAKKYDSTPEEVMEELRQSMQTTTNVDTREHYDYITKHLISKRFKNVKAHNDGNTNKIKVTITIIKNNKK